MADSIRSWWVPVVVALLAGWSPLGHAAEAQLPTLVPKLDPAWERLGQSNARFLTTEQQALLHDLAFALAAAASCPGFQIDRAAFDKAFDGFKGAEYMKEPAERKRKMEYRLMFNLGAAAALYSAEGLLHPREGCKLAEAKRTEGPGRFWLKPASASGTTP